MLAVCGGAATAVAATTIYTSQAAFDAAAPGVVTFDFPNVGVGPVPVSPSYNLAGVTFASSDENLYSDIYPTPYLGDQAATFTISTSKPDLSLELGSYYGPNTYDYIVNGVAGSVSTPLPGSTTFLGFTNPGGSISVTFSVPSELDVTQIMTVPEPSTWALILVGIGALGGVLRARGRRLAAI